MSQAKGGRTARERHWRGVLERWQASAGSVRDFCERAGVSEPSFYQWRRRLGVPAKRAEPAASGRVGGLLPVRIVGDGLEGAGAADGATAAGVEVMLASGRRLRVAREFDEATLRRLLAVLEDLPC